MFIVNARMSGRMCMLRCCLTDRIRNYFEPACLTLRVLADSLHFLKRGAASFPLFCAFKRNKEEFS